MQQKGGEGLVGILLRTLTNISLDILVSHGVDITHHLHQAVRVCLLPFHSTLHIHFALSCLILIISLSTFLNSTQILHISSLFQI